MFSWGKFEVSEDVGCNMLTKLNMHQGATVMQEQTSEKVCQGMMAADLLTLGNTKPYIGTQNTQNWRIVGESHMGEVKDHVRFHVGALNVRRA